jgi:hypothetical protein
MVTPAPRLTTADLAWLREQLRALPGGWVVEAVEEPDDLSAVLLPTDGDRFAATFLIDRRTDGYRVMACRWDAMTLIGVFPTLAASLAPVAASAMAASQAAPFPNLQ